MARVGCRSRPSHAGARPHCLAGSAPCGMRAQFPRTPRLILPVCRVELRRPPRACRYGAGNGGLVAKAPTDNSLQNPLPRHEAFHHRALRSILPAEKLSLSDRAGWIERHPGRHAAAVIAQAGEIENNPILPGRCRPAWKIRPARLRSGSRQARMRRSSVATDTVASLGMALPDLRRKCPRGAGLWALFNRATTLSVPPQPGIGDFRGHARFLVWMSAADRVRCDSGRGAEPGSGAQSACVRLAKS